MTRVPRVRAIARLLYAGRKRRVAALTAVLARLSPDDLLSVMRMVEIL